MPKEIFFEIKDKDFIFRIQESLVHGVRVEIYQEIRAGSALIYGYNKSLLSRKSGQVGL